MPDVSEQLRNWSQSLADVAATTDIERVIASRGSSRGRHRQRRAMAVAASVGLVVAGIVAVAELSDGGSDRISSDDESPAAVSTTSASDRGEFDISSVFGDVEASDVAVTSDGRVIAGVASQLLIRHPDGEVEAIDLESGAAVSEAWVGPDEIAVVWGADSGAEIDLRTGEIITALTRFGDSWTRSEPGTGYSVQASSRPHPLGLPLVVDEATDLPETEGSGGWWVVSDEANQWTIGEPRDGGFFDEVAPLATGGYIVTMRVAVVPDPNAAPIVAYVLDPDGTHRASAEIGTVEQAVDVQPTPDGLTVLIVDGTTANIALVPFADLPPSSDSFPPNSELRFRDPLQPGTVAMIEPPPAAPVVAYQSGRVSPELAFGTEGLSTVWVISENEWVGSLSVNDQALPWEIATMGYDRSVIKGVDAVVDETQSVVALRLESGGTRVVGSDPSEPALMQAAIELAELIGAGPVEPGLAGSGFVVPVGSTMLSPAVSYGSRDDGSEVTEVFIARFDRSPTEDELRWMATALSQGNRPERIQPGTFESTLDAGQRSMIELVSPLDVVSILAPPGTDITALRETLVFESVEQAGLTVEQIGSNVNTPNVIASGQHDWGRWQVATSDDGRCRSVAHSRWTAGELVSIPAAVGVCDPDTPFTDAICVELEGQQTLVVALGTDAAAVAVELDGTPVTATINDGEGGAALLVDGVAPGQSALVVRINGIATTCR